MSLRDAERTDMELREQLNDLVRARARAQSEAERLGVRASLPGADAGLRTLVDDYRGQEQRLGQEVERVRASLRAHEGELERARASAAAETAGAAADASTAGGPPTARGGVPATDPELTRQQEPPTGAGGSA